MTKMFTKWLKNFQWMNTRVGKGFFKEKIHMFIQKSESVYCESLQNISSTALHSRKQLSSALKYVVK